MKQEPHSLLALSAPTSVLGAGHVFVAFVGYMEEEEERHNSHTKGTSQYKCLNKPGLGTPGVQISNF